MTIFRTPEQDKEIDIAIERLDEIMELRRLNREGFPRESVTAAIVRAAIVIDRDTPISWPGHEKPAHWFESNANGFTDEL